MKFKSTRSLALSFRDGIDISGISFLLLIDVGISTTTGSEPVDVVSLCLAKPGRRKRNIYFETENPRYQKIMELWRATIISPPSLGCRT